MSADNRVCIMQNWEGMWAVWDGSGSMDYYEPPERAKLFDTQSEAIDAALKMDAESYYEYGVGCISVQEQTEGLNLAIVDLQMRLDRLQKTGTQWIQEEKSQ